jgi:hypothetical protein
MGDRISSIMTELPTSIADDVSTHPPCISFLPLIHGLLLTFKFGLFSFNKQITTSIPSKENDDTTPLQRNTITSLFSSEDTPPSAESAAEKGKGNDTTHGMKVKAAVLMAKVRELVQQSGDLRMFFKLSLSSYFLSLAFTNEAPSERKKKKQSKIPATPLQHSYPPSKARPTPSRLFSPPSPHPHLPPPPPPIYHWQIS